MIFKGLCVRDQVELSISLIQDQKPTSACAQKLSLLVFLISDIALVFWYTEPFREENTKTSVSTNITTHFYIIIQKYSGEQILTSEVQEKKF